MSSSGANRGALLGTAAARPASAAPSQLYFATDTSELTVFSSGAWHSLGQVSGNLIVTGTLKPQSPTAIQSNVANEAAAATAGAGAAPPATVQGYIVVQDSGGTGRKIPYYAN